MLFVDEAYSLVKDSKDSFGREALDTLIKLVEDLKDTLVVVLAGYTREMEELLSHNPGVRQEKQMPILRCRGGAMRTIAPVPVPRL